MWRTCLLPTEPWMDVDLYPQGLVCPLPLRLSLPLPLLYDMHAHSSPAPCTFTEV